MKQESKETVKFIKDVLKGYKIHVETDNFLESDDKSTELINIKTAFDFLDSLPEIELHLCRGGYIQDRNGTPCCDGDKVLFQNEMYILKWDAVPAKFYLKDKKARCYNITTFFKDEIEKVTE